MTPTVISYNPFDPIQDTEREVQDKLARLQGGYNPFDPIQDTERVSQAASKEIAVMLQPIRSDTGY